VAPPFYAQSGEDRLLAERFGKLETGYFVEIGAFNGVTNSNTYHFEQLGWQGVLVEANPVLADQCRAARPGSTVFACAAVAPNSSPTVSFEIAEGDPALSSLAITADMLRRVPGRRVTRVTVPARPLDAILDESGLPRIDFVTVDVEGHEYEVLQGFTLARWRPQVVILERNTHFPEYRILRHMHRNGYVLERTTGVNDWYVPSASTDAGPAYLGRLLGTYYAPKLITAWRPIVRSVLLKAGVLH
jgi:FkbM family methyltransferase